MDNVQDRRKEHKGEFDGLGYPSQKSGERHGEQHSSHQLPVFRTGGAVHREARRWETEHHNRKKTGHERAGRWIAREEAMEIPGYDFSIGSGVAAEDKPDETVKDVVQTSHQEDPVQHTVNEKTQETGPGKRMADPVDASLHRRPDEAAH